MICSPEAARSRWVNEEILAFKRLGREDRIFPLIVSGEPNASSLPGRESEECFPPALRFHLRTDGTLGDAPAEPVAADARPGKDGSFGSSPDNPDPFGDVRGRLGNIFFTINSRILKKPVNAPWPLTTPPPACH